MTTVAREWRSQAGCRDVDPELFFPTAEDGPAYATQVAAAKAVCAACPVRAECLAEALTRMPYGIAGGLTPDERSAHRAGRPEPSTAVERAPADLDAQLTDALTPATAGGVS